MKRFRIATLALSVLSMVLSPLSVFATDGIYDPDFYSNNDIVIYNPQDTTCASSSGGDASQLVGTDNRQKIWNWLTAKGLTPNEAAGIMGNIQTESAGSWSPAVNEYGKDFGKGGYGIVQWTNYKDLPGGRRDQFVASLTASIPDVMAKYYNGDYATAASATNQQAGFIPKSASTGTPMDSTSNDAMLLAELNYMYTESTSRTVSSSAVALGLGTKGETEWDAIKGLATTDDVARLWVYSYEVPAKPDQTSLARIANATAILGIYANTATGASCTGNGDGGTKQQIAQQIVSNPNITYDGGNEAARQKQLIADVASGSNNGNTFPCGVNIQILRIIAALGKDHKIRINDLNRACTNSVAGGASSTTSRHYAGNGSAVDLGPIDGKSPYSTAGASLIVSVIAPLLANQSALIGQSQCAGLSSGAIGVPAGVGRFSDACTHLHIEVSPSVDSSLQCKYPVNQGTCNPPQRIN